MRFTTSFLILIFCCESLAQRMVQNKGGDGGGTEGRSVARVTGKRRTGRSKCPGHR